ncbi:MAG TPA: glucan biosynthesis protein D [Candidatus Angelobacter sp.]|nr:glucan biosynthesis protein D [Candidatus Angelobacter sp.]
MLDRRRFLQVALAAQAVAVMPAQAGAAGLRFGTPHPFSFERLKAQAEALAAAPYVPPPRPDPKIVASIDYDAYGKLKYRPEFALYGDGEPGAFPVMFSYVGEYFPKTVRMFAVEPGADGGGLAREVLYDPEYFIIPANSVAAHLAPDPSPFGGFTVREAKGGSGDWRREEPWVEFRGASYFRAIGALGQVGLSARGIALTPGGGGPEEFPDFIAFWFLPAAAAGDPLTAYALLDGPSVAGAYRFLMTRTKGVVMEIEKALFFRQPVDRLGLAPLTTMYWYSETVKPTAVDWRPEVHDSDGLALWTGAGERIWRPLVNPAHTTVSSFFDERPRGFGLLQRDRQFDHYLDGVAYDRRPSAWVEPLGEWGRGAVELVEMPTDDEIFDNVTAYWCPAAPTKAGDRVDLRYRLHWLADEPYPTPLGRCVASRLGRGGQPGLPRPDGVRKFMVEFLGGPLAQLPFGVKPEPVLWSSRGKFSYVYTEAVPDDLPGHWRAQFDLTVDGHDPVEMRLFLRANSQVLTETWLYQYHPFPTDARPVGF